MAKFREYGYYLKGNKLAIVEKDQVIDTEVSTTDINAFKRNTGLWKSPLETVADALQIEYAYNPKYHIETTNDVDQNITQYQSTDGYLSIADNTSAYINYATTYALAADSFIVLRKAGRFNGLHKIKAISNNTGTNNKITLYTRYSGSEAAWTDFEETPDLYYAVDVLNDEGDDLNIPPYLELAVVDYVKAHLAQDALNIEMYEYFMKQFRKKLEQHENARIYGPRLIIAGTHAIR